MKKEVYTTPELELIRFVTADVITISGEEGTESSPSTEPEQPVLPWD